MNILALVAVMPPQNLFLDTGMPLYILLPLIIVIGIGVVVVTRWIYGKTSK